MTEVTNLEKVDVQPSPHSFRHLLETAESRVLRDSFVLIPPAKSTTGLTAGYTVIYPGCRTSGHAHEEYEEVYHITKGSGVMRVGEEEFNIRAGDTFLVPCGAYHATVNPHSEVLEYFWVLSPKVGREE